MNCMTEIKIDGKLHINIKSTGQGFVGIVEELPIVVESPTEQQLAIDVTKALATCFVHNPKTMNKFLSVKIPA